ncbi:unnamed protein product [Caenorhabditis auriculariae]|uniref:2'-O-ribose RNA methyltransferase TRM7 homolog n=1 Tax=Caenorhabditis auriculariae TaxID=2777116 RepID=A0A8S1GP68_9PELO|nr:unnamed protein product [Caenorhabditis auriculariae]
MHRCSLLGLFLLFSFVLTVLSEDYLEDHIRHRLNHPISACDDFYAHVCPLDLRKTDLISTKLEDLHWFNKRNLWSPFDQYLKSIFNFANSLESIKIELLRLCSGGSIQKYLAGKFVSIYLKKNVTGNCVHNVGRFHIAAKLGFSHGSEYFEDFIDVTRQNVKKTSWLRKYERTEAFSALLRNNFSFFGYEEKEIKRAEIHYKAAMNIALHCTRRINETGLNFICAFTTFNDYYESVTAYPDRYDMVLLMGNFNAFNLDVGVATLRPVQYLANSKKQSRISGALGFIVGHEIMHTFYAKKNDPPEVAKFFKKSYGCVARQYQKTCRFYAKGNCVSGTNFTNEEDGADMTSVRIAYETYFKCRLGKEKSDIDGVSQDQMFFYSLVAPHCKVVGESRYFSHPLDPHSQIYVRINAVMSQMEEFKKAFNCSNSSKMIQSKGEHCNMYGTDEQFSSKTPQNFLSNDSPPKKISASLLTYLEDGTQDANLGGKEKTSENLLRSTDNRYRSGPPKKNPSRVCSAIFAPIFPVLRTLEALNSLQVDFFRNKSKVFFLPPCDRLEFFLPFEQSETKIGRIIYGQFAFEVPFTVESFFIALMSTTFFLNQQLFHSAFNSFCKRIDCTTVKTVSFGTKMRKIPRDLLETKLLLVTGDLLELVQSNFPNLNRCVFRCVEFDFLSSFVESSTLRDRIEHLTFDCIPRYFRGCCIMQMILGRNLKTMNLHCVSSEISSDLNFAVIEEIEANQLNLDSFTWEFLQRSEFSQVRELFGRSQRISKSVLYCYLSHELPDHAMEAFGKKTHCYMNGKPDIFSRRAKKEHWRSRSAFKLMHIDDEFKILKGVTRAIDLCSAPGSWCQVLSKRLDVENEHVKIIGVDPTTVSPIPGVTMLEGAIHEDETITKIIAELDGVRVDIVLCDGSPDATVNLMMDEMLQRQLITLAFKVATQTLKVGGTFLSKIFGCQNKELVYAQMRKFFARVEMIKPRSSRPTSSETYVLCTNFQPLLGTAPDFRCAKPGEVILPGDFISTKDLPFALTGDMSEYDEKLDDCPLDLLLGIENGKNPFDKSRYQFKNCGPPPELNISKVLERAKLAREKPTFFELVRKQNEALKASPGYVLGTGDLGYLEETVEGISDLFDEMTLPTENPDSSRSSTPIATSEYSFLSTSASTSSLYSFLSTSPPNPQ